MPIRSFFGQKNDAQDNGYNNEYYATDENAREDDYGYAAAEQPEPKAEPARPARRQAENGSTCSMKLMKPTSYDDGAAVANALMTGNAVILNLEGTSPETKSNLIYFLDGVTFAIGGQIKPITADTYILTAKNMNITEDEETAAPREEPVQEQPAPAGNNYGYQGYGSGFRG